MKSVVWNVLSPIIGEPAWGVRQGWGSSLFLEFGPPHLRTFNSAGPLRVFSRTDANRRPRRIVATGKWHLWLQMCAWRILLDETEVLHSESARDAIWLFAEKEVTGRKLEGLLVDPVTGGSCFQFEASLRILTRPVERAADEWHVFMVEGTVLTYRGDGFASFGQSTIKLDERTWKRVEEAITLPEALLNG